MQKERKNRLRFSLHLVLKSGTSLVLTYFALFIALVSYFYPLIKIDEKGINLPPKVLEFVLQPLIKNLSGTLPFFDPEMTIDEMLSLEGMTERFDPASLPSDILEKFKGEDIKQINPQEVLKDPAVIEFLRSEVQKVSKKIDPKILAGQRSEMAKNLGIELRGDEKMVDIINKLANEKLKGIVGPRIKYFPIISAVLSFFLLRIIFIPFSWLVLTVSFVIFQFFLLFRIVWKEKVIKEGDDVGM